MPPLQPNNFTKISTTNIIDVPRPGRRTRSRKSQKSNAPSPAQISTSNIIDEPNTPRKTRRGTIPASPVVRAASTRTDTRHDPITRKDRAARLQRTTGGRFAKTKSKSNAKETKRDAQDGEDTQDDEDPLSQMDDSRLKRATAKTLGESDGNATRTPYKGPTAHEMLKALEESIADALDSGINNRNIEPGNTGNNTASARPTRAGSPVSDDNDEQPSTRGRTPSSRQTSPKPPTPSQSKRILTYPNGPNMPPLITYIHTPPPPPAQTRSPSPRSSYNI
ncbi:MAG: hypothetical protein L6R38_009470, partial [Xanthoria sp. 2 TBL-2021]